MAQVLWKIHYRVCKILNTDAAIETVGRAGLGTRPLKVQPGGGSSFLVPFHTPPFPALKGQPFLTSSPRANPTA